MSVLIDLLVDVLPPLQARVRTHRLEPFAKRLGQLTDPRDFAREEQPALRLATLAALIVRVVKELQIEIAEHDRHVAAHVDAYSRASSDEARRVRMDMMIDETAPTPRAVRRDRQALERFLDLDAMRERYALVREELVIMAELGIIAVGPAIAKAMESEAISASTSFVVDVSMGIESEIRTILGQVEPVMFLVEQLSIVRRWPTRLACVESLEAVLSYLGPPRSKGGRGHRGESPHRAVTQMLRVLRTVGMDRSEHEWVQARALSCLRIIDSDAYRECVVERLALTQGPDWAPEWPERDFLTRGLLVDQLAHQLTSKADAQMLERALERGEASEFVRITHAKALEQLAVSGHGFFARLARLLTRTPGDVDRQAEEDEEEDVIVPRTQVSSSQWLAAKPSFPSEESGQAPIPDRDAASGEGEPAPAQWQVQTDAGLELPRVHGSACIAMTNALGHIGRGTKARKHGRVIVERLAATIAEIDDPLVAKIACEMAPIACAHIAANKGLRRDLDRSTKQLVEALKQCLSDASRSAAIHEEASAAIEGIDQGARRDRAQWTEALREAIEQIPAPGEATIELPSHEGDRPSSAELARILPQLTRNDWGLDVDVHGSRMTVRRGDHKVPRMWRIMHEIRNHAGNKRQAYRHSIGRRFTGRLRAHAGRLDEVTMTVVPGERLHLSPEGGWGRHIPLVDDLLGMPWLRKGEASKVEIASSHGVTSLRLRGRLAQRLRARWRLNFKYAELAELRRRTLMADEPA